MMNQAQEIEARHRAADEANKQATEQRRRVEQVKEEGGRRALVIVAAGRGSNLTVSPPWPTKLPGPSLAPVLTPQQRFDERKAAEAAQKRANQIVNPERPVHLPFLRATANVARQSDFDHRLRQADRPHLPAPCSVDYYKRNATYLDAKRFADMRYGGSGVLRTKDRSGREFDTCVSAWNKMWQHWGDRVIRSDPPVGPTDMPFIRCTEERHISLS